MAGVEWTPDGRIVYASMAQGSWDLWIADPNGSAPRQLTNDAGAESVPRMLPDGAGVAYISRPSGDDRMRIRAIDLDGGHAREFQAEGVQPSYLQVGARHIYFNGLVGNKAMVHRVPLSGGAPEPLFPNPARLPPNFSIRLVSMDGHWALGATLDPKVAGVRLALVLVGLAQPVRMFPFPFPMPSEYGFAWAPGGAAFDVMVPGQRGSNVWRFPLDGRAPAPITAFTAASERPLTFGWSRDGTRLAMSRITQSADVVLLTSSVE